MNRAHGFQYRSYTGKKSLGYRVQTLENNDKKKNTLDSIGFSLELKGSLVKIRGLTFDSSRKQVSKSRELFSSSEFWGHHVTL